MASAWHDGVVTSPAAGQVISDTGQLANALGTVIIQVVVDASVAAFLAIEHRNAANNTTLHTQYVSVVASTPFVVNQFTMIFQDNERIRVINRSALVLGTVSASIFLS